MPAIPKTHRLFVYGIFLDESNRKAYGMSNPQYAVVRNMATYTLHGNIVQADYVDPDCGAALTGLLVNVEEDKWSMIDSLERDYQRQLVPVYNELAWIYAVKREV